jgi:hypothetical protein
MLKHQRLFLSAASGALIAVFAVSGTVFGEVNSFAAIDVSVRSTAPSKTDFGRIFLDLVLRNTSDSQMFFWAQNQDWDFQIEILGPDGSPLELTNYGKCVLPVPTVTISTKIEKLEPGDKDRVESVELNRLFKLDHVGRHRVMVRRTLWRVASGSPPISLETFLFECRPQAVCRAELVIVSSTPSFFAITSPYPDSSPHADPTRCR